MFLGMILAATLQAGVAPAAAPLIPVPPPDWRRKPSAEILGQYFPFNAVKYGVAGEATMRCEIGLMGELNYCEVLSESPEGWGFGEATLKLAPSFLMTAGVPSKPDGRRPEVVIPIHWGKGSGMPTLRGSDFGYLAHPVWLSAPSAADVAAAYPKAGAGADGYVALTCNVIRGDGRLGRCLVRMEDPLGHNFAKAAIALTGKFVLVVPQAEQKDAMGIWTDLRIKLSSPGGAAAEPEIRHANWVSGPESVAGQMFPDMAARKGIRSGEGEAECAVGPGGAMQTCQPVGDGDPGGLGFAEAAAKAAASLRLSTWTEGGAPAEGAKVRVSFRFNQPPP